MAVFDRARNRHLIYVAGFLMDFVCAFIVGAVAVYAVELGASPVQLGLIGATGAALYVAASLSAGRLCDRFSRKISILAYCAVGAAASLLFVRARLIAELFIYYGLYHLSIGLFWPTLQSLLADSRHRRNLTTTLGNFCLSWSLGFAAGHYACGWLTRIDSRLPFLWCVYLSLAILLVCLALSDLEGDEKSASRDYLDRAEGKPRALWEKYLVCGWLANFTLVFILGTAKMLFPKLALDVDGLDRSTLGLMLALIHGGQFLMFWLVRYWHGWQYNRRVYLTVQLLALPGTGLLAFTSSVFTYAAGMLLVGICAGFTYTSSIYYSASRPPDSSTRTGFHEAFIGLGILIGPLTGGFVAGKWGLHAPYTLGILLAVSVLLLQSWLLYRPAHSFDKAKVS
ncbi:MAG TPA: MFS transporter [Candidatus Glassbacteria bacterium]|nr:MFS transporter [Candidatus Glassbacteria bacterium]